MKQAAHTPARSRVIAVSSGKGGVGKTNVSVNLAIALARKGHRICVFDADTSLANVNILLNLTPEFTLEHVLNGSKRIEDILLQGPGDITIVPAASGIAEFASLSVPQQKLLLQALTTLEQQFDYLIIDMPPGTGDVQLSLCQRVPLTGAVVVTTPQAVALAGLRRFGEAEHQFVDHALEPRFFERR